MKKCRHCKGTNFGVTVTETKVSRFRVINGKAEEMLGEPEITSKTDIVYCFTCNNAITEEDVFENETCPVCGKITEELVNGRCKECDEKVKSYSKMTKEQIIMMMMQNTSQNTVDTTKKEKQDVTEIRVSTETESEGSEIKEIGKDECNIDPNVSLITPISKDVNLKERAIEMGGLNPEEGYEDLNFAPELHTSEEEDILSQLNKAVPAGSINVLSEF